MAPDRLHRPYRVGERRAGSSRSRSRMPCVINPGGGCPVARVGRVAHGPARTLAARVHDQVGIAGAGPQEPLVGEAAAAAVADVFDHRWRTADRRPADGANPGRGTAETGETHVERIDHGQPAVDRFEGRVKVVAAGVGQRSRPELVQVRWDWQIGRVGRSSGSGRSNCGTGGLPWCSLYASQPRESIGSGSGGLRVCWSVSRMYRASGPKHTK